MNLLEWLMNFGPAGLVELRKSLELIQKLRDAETLEDQIKIVTELLQAIANLTPTAVDNDLLTTLQKFVTTGLISELVKLVGRFTGATASVMSAEDQAVEIAMYQTQGIGFAEAIALARLIAQLIKMANQFRGSTI